MLLGVAFTFGLTGLSPSLAEAAPSATDQQPLSTTLVPSGLTPGSGALTPECQIADPQVVKEADLATEAAAAKLCLAWGKRGSGPLAPSASGPSPENTEYGNCGSSTFYLYDDSSGDVIVDMALYPTPAPLLYGVVTFVLDNYTSGFQKSYNVGVYPNSGTGWYMFTPYHTGVGVVVGEITGGDVLLASGEVCGVLTPYDVTVVT